MDLKEQIKNYEEAKKKAVADIEADFDVKIERLKEQLPKKKKAKKMETGENLTAEKVEVSEDKE